MSDGSTNAVLRAAMLVAILVGSLAGCLNPPAATPSDPISVSRVVVTVQNYYRADVTV